MHILLLTIASIGLERLGENPTIDSEIASYNTNIGALGQDVEKRGLTSTTLTHQGCHLTGRNVTRHIIKQATRLVLNLDVIADVAPAEYLIRYFEGTSVMFVFFFVLSPSATCLFLLNNGVFRVIGILFQNLVINLATLKHHDTS